MPTLIALLAPLLTVAPGPDLLIVVPRALAPAVEPYLEARRQSLPAEIVLLEDALGAAGEDDPERLKRYLYNRWQDSGRRLRSVLLVGDADVMPVRYMVLDRNTPAAFDYAFYPTDLYYADIARTDGSFDDWNAQKDGFHSSYFGEVRGEKNKSDPINFDGVSYLPELAVGRWPVSTPEEARTVADKSLAYLRHAPDASPRAGLVASGGWIENRPAMDRIAGKLPPGWAAERLYFADSGRDDHTPAPDAAGVVSLVKSGVPLILHSGHGSDDSWHGAIGVGSIGRFSNADHPAIFFSAGCSTARLATLPPYEGYTDVHGAEHRGTNAGEVFDAPPPPPAPYQRSAHNPTGLGEQLLRAGPSGAVAYIGCNTGSQPCGMTLLEGFVEAMGAPSEHPTTLGDCWNGAVVRYHAREGLADLRPTESWYPASIFFQGMKFMLFGDPSLPMPARR